MSFSNALAAADRAILNLLEGGPVTYTPGTGVPVSVVGIFDESYVDADLGHAGVSTFGPAVFLRLEDLPSHPRDDENATVTIDGVIFKPRVVKPDGLGGILLLLHLV